MKHSLCCAPAIQLALLAELALASGRSSIALLPPRKEKNKASLPFRTWSLPLCNSDSLNISERARWVACLLGRTRGHGRQDIIPSGRRINNNTFDVSNGDIPAAGPLGSSGKNKGMSVPAG